ncbi:MAG: endonuclease/exonuclease/phosphatase family protein [Candidatus Lokiarchaeota archaeon]|nr:endonuclease/exonuclease/phosphatase family protein [Candidatus Lokiarchaeota archaeon]
MALDKFIKKYYSEIVLLGILFLFFFQHLTDFVESIYLLNLIETDINESIAAILFLLAPIVLIAFKDDFPDKISVLLVEIMVVSRILYPFFDTQIKVILTGLGTGCFLIFLPAYLQKTASSKREKNALTLGIALAAGLILSILFRTLGSSIDLTLSFWFQWIGWILAAYSSIMALDLLRLEKENKISANPKNKINEGEKKTKSRLSVLCLGLTSVLILCYFAFSSPTVIARWSEGNIVAITTVLALVFTIFIAVAYLKPHFFNKLPPIVVLLWNGAFVLTLVLTIGLNQIPFALVSTYPYFPPETTVFNLGVLYAMLLLSPIILVDFTLLVQELFKKKPSIRNMGRSFSLSALFILVIILSAVFVPVWDYIPVIGPLFKDMIWFVFLISGIVLILPFLVVKKPFFTFPSSSLEDLALRIKKFSIILIIMLGTIVGGIILEIPFVQPPGKDGTLSILTYNIQQGASDGGSVNFEGQCAVIQNLNPDIIGLQESDTARIANGNTDFVRYISNTIGYYSYYGPKTVTNTFGIALLSKYPIHHARTFYMKCVGEQTATIWAQITVGTTTFNVFVTHLGNYENSSEGDTTQLVQQQNILTITEGKENVLLMGDFNFEPRTEQYNITVAQLYDAWEIVLATHPANAIVDSNLPGEREIPTERIDHIFVSSHLNSSLTSIHYTGGHESDHPALFATISTTSI